MEQIKIIKGSIEALVKPVDVVIIRTKVTKEILFDKSKYSNSAYCISIPDKKLDGDNVIDYLEYYKKAIKKVKNMGLKTVALEALDLGDDDLNFELAVEFAQVLKDAIGLTIGIDPIVVTLICKNRDLGDVYELAIYGEIRSSQVTMIDRLEKTEVIIIPTQNNILKFDKNYKILKRMEPKSVFFKCYFHRKLLPGKYFLVKGQEYSDYYFFANLIRNKKLPVDEFKVAALTSVKNVLDSANNMSCKNVVVPVIRFMKKEKENEEFVRELVETVCDFAEDKEMDIQFYCPDPELWDVVMDCFNESDEA